MNKNSTKRKLPTKMWAGFTDGKMDTGAMLDAMSGAYGMLYPSKRAAQRMYEDVRRVEIREIKSKRGPYVAESSK